MMVEPRKEEAALEAQLWEGISRAMALQKPFQEVVAEYSLRSDRSL
jgi:hypothetical protein